MEPPVTFGDWIRQRRRALDLTQADLAIRVGCSISAIRKIETGDRRPSRQIVALLANALDVPAEDRALFTSVARGERSINRLAASASPAAPVNQPKRGSIPRPLTPLVGREPELSQVIRLLSSQECRWLTLIGPGGIGKTRIAIQAATRLQHTASLFSGGIYFVPLSALTSRDQVLSAIADALSFTFFGPELPADQLVHYLREKHILLVLDNFEHLSGAAALLAELLASAPGLKVLITSQERLHTQAEWVFEIHGLPLPDGQAPIPLDQLQRFSAVELFFQTAMRADPGFALDSENQADVLRICRAVDGLPLGIELAASWVRTLTCREIAEEITHGLDFLTTADRSLPERHKSLRAVFEYAWRLLTPDERSVLSRLSLLYGSIHRESASEVAGATLPLLSSLVDKSLLRHTHNGYHMHGLVRQYAAQRLAEDVRQDDRARQEYSDYFLGLLARSESVLLSLRIRTAMTQLNDEIDNIRRAWSWAAEHHRVQQMADATDALYLYMEMRGAYLEAQQLFSDAAEKLGGWGPEKAGSDPLLSLTLGRIFTKEAFFNMRLGKQGQAEPLFNLSISLLRPLAAAENTEAVHALSEALVMLATAKWHMGHFETARSLAGEALELARAVFNRWNTAYALLILALVDHSQGHIDTAYPTVMESMANWRQVQDVRGLTLGLSYAALIANDAGKPGEARDMLRECLEISRAIDDRWGVAMALNHLGQITFTLGKTEREEAIQMLRESVALYREMGEPWNMGRALIRLGEAHHHQGDDAAAAQVLVEAVRIGWESPVIPLALDAMLRLAVILADRGSLRCAMQVLAPVRAHPLCYEETREQANVLWADWEAQAETQPDTHLQEFDSIVEQVLNWCETFAHNKPCD